MRTLHLIAFTGAFALDLPAQTGLAPAPAPVASSKQIEPGLEAAVDWKWWVVPSDEKPWGLPIDEPPPPTVSVTPTAAGASAGPSGPRPTEYVVEKGDAISRIARKFGMTSQQLKTFNNLPSDTIKIGQTLKIPTVEEVKAMAPPPPPVPVAAPAGKKKQQPEVAPRPESEFLPPGQEDLMLQVFLDREHFSSGPIDGSAGPMFAKVLQLYRAAHPEYIDANSLKKHAQETVGSLFVKYKLRAADFRFIDKTKESAPVLTGKKGAVAAGKAVEAPAPTYRELVAAPCLVYRSGWEFVAERFHCAESYLRQLNPRIKGTPVEGTEFQVPNVTPFEIEHALEQLAQPAADPLNPVTLSLVELNRVEVSQGGKLLTVAPIGLARPDLRGRGSWTILDAVIRPRLATLQELKSPPKRAAPTLTEDLQRVAPAETVNKAVLPSEQYLAAGPNNPVGVVWFNLSKPKSTEPLPYGLHGTSIPGRMKAQEGIGGIRMTNWDIVRLVRLLPSGTPLQWK